MTKKPLKSQNAFTIVELLIVIVVIGILASVTIVAYRGVQNRANDTAVLSDLRDFSSKVSVFYSENGRYPYPVTGNELSTLGIKFSPATLNALVPTTNNMLYCGNDTTGIGFAIIAQNKSGVKYISTSANSTAQVYTGIYSSGAPTCSAQAPEYTSWKWGVNTAGVQGF